MPKFDASAQITAARKWATAHVVIAVIIAFVAGILVRSIL